MLQVSKCQMVKVETLQSMVFFWMSPSTLLRKLYGYNLSSSMVTVGVQNAKKKGNNISMVGEGPPHQSQKKHSLKKVKSVEKLGGGGGGHVTSSKLKLIKYVSTEENDDIVEEVDL